MEGVATKLGRVEKNKIPYFETYHFCKHENLWSKYKEITDVTFKITKILDDALWKTDERYKNLRWNLQSTGILS